LHVLGRTLLPWAVPLILGLLTLVLRLIVLMLLTRSSISHVLRMLTPPLLILGGAVAAAVLASGLQLPQEPALARFYEQLSKIGELTSAQQPAPIDQALREERAPCLHGCRFLVPSLPPWLPSPSS
jgi:hypothetical protein